MKVNRFDLGEIKSPSITTHGYLRADSLATRAGVFTYMMKDGSVRRELRPVDEVFKQDSLDTMKLIPVTNNHPPEQLNAENTKKYQTGYTGEDVCQISNNFMKVGVTVTDKGTINDIMAGKNQMSAGYTCDLEIVSGIFDGEKYDAIQRNIIYNHLAIVDIARAGPEAKMKLDSENCFFDENNGFMIQNEERKDELNKKNSGADSEIVSTLNDKKQNKKQGVNQMPKIKIDSVEWELTENQAPLAQVIVSKMDSIKELNEKLSSLQSELDKEKGRADGLAIDLDKEKKNKLSDKEMLALSKGRLDAIDFAKKVKAEFNEDSETIEIKKAAILKLHPETNFDGKSEDYIQGRFDSVYANNKEGKEEGKTLENALCKVVTDSSDLSEADKKRIEYENKKKNAWKPESK